jgi:hypothetical protein
MRFAAAMAIFFYVFVAFILTASTQAQTTPEARKPVLVELFTSEGCSSCPPADVMLQKLVQLQPVPSADIIALEEHVDYWNHDGWVDPFSSPEWTERQQNYVALTNGQAYTPELIVDGESQFNGSDGPKALSEIEKAAKAPTTEVTVTPEKNSRRIAVSVGNIPQDLGKDSAEVWLAVTEDGLHSQATAGENKGRALTHIATVRSLRKLGTADAQKPVAFTGNAEVKINSHWNAANVRVVVFVQRKKSRAILGVGSAKIEG